MRAAYAGACGSSRKTGGEALRRQGRLKRAREDWSEGGSEGARGGSEERRERRGEGARDRARERGSEGREGREGAGGRRASGKGLGAFDASPAAAEPKRADTVGVLA